MNDFSDELTTTDGTVGMVHVHCPACGNPVEVDVQVAALTYTGGSYFYVDFKRSAPKHACAGKRS